MPDFDEKGRKDWIDLLTALGSWVGMNPVRTRWKLMAWRDSWKASKNNARQTVNQITYQHKICPHCGNVQDRSNRTCSNCGKALSPRFIEMLGRLGLIAPHVRSVSSLLTMGIIICYLRTMLAQGGMAFFSMNPSVLVEFGGNYPPAVMGGEWWRLSTYIFLHAGLWHIAFNLIALQQIGPQFEEVFGKGRVLFIFMVTGIIAGLGSEMMGLRGVGIGASGALMGLIGFAAGWGHRDGTSTGRNVRDMMVKWALYTMVFGFMIGADNAAHGFGFASGAVFGLFSKPVWERPTRSAVDVILSLVGGLLAVVTVFLVLFPPGQ